MKPAKNRLCLCCIAPLEADYRNAYHQEYCSRPPCRKASKAASQRLWLAKPENANYHSGPVAVARVSDWQKVHPEFRERQKIKRQAALQDFIITQPFVFVGLLAHLFNFTLQDDIASTALSLQKLGEDIANGKGQDEFFKTGNLFGTGAAGARTVQLGGSAIGAG